MKIKITISIAISIIVLFFMIPPVNAAWQVSPDIIDAVVSSGDNSLPTITIGNDSDNPVDFKVVLAGYGQSADGSTNVLDEDSNPLSAVPYIKFSPVEFHLGPGETQKISLSVTIPNSVDGGRYAVLLAVTNPQTGNGINTITRLGVPIRLTVADSRLIKTGSAVILSDIPVESDKPVQLKVTFTNSGNIHYKVQSNLIISNSQGEIVGTVLSNSGMVLPGYTRDLIANWTPVNDLPKGIYKLDAKVLLEDGTVLDEATSSFEVGKIYVPPPAPASITLKPAVESVLKTSDGRISISFPKGAVTGEVTVSLQNYPLEQLPAPPEGYQLATTCFRVDGLTGLLVKKATVSVQYTEADQEKANGDATRLKLARWDEGNGQWTVLKTSVDKGSMTLSTDTNQFSIWAVMVGEEQTGLNWGLIIGIIAGVVVVCLAIIFFIKRRK